MDTLIEQLVPVLAAAAISVLTGLLAIGIKRFNAYIGAKVDSEKMQSALLQLSDAVAATVMDLETTVRRSMSDGKLSRAEATELKRMAMERVLDNAPRAIQAISRAGVYDIEKYLSGKIETAVANMPRKLESVIAAE